MDPSELEKIDKFLQAVGKRDLFEYYEIAHAAPDAETETVIRKRRSWAQGQQANPRHKQQAMWLIRNHKLVSKTLLEQRAVYIEHTQQQSSAEGLSELATFIEGIITVSGGVISAPAQSTIVDRGQKLGLAQDQVVELLERMVEAANGQIVPADAAEPPFVDYYALLEASAGDSVEIIEQKHRAKYRWARQLQDHERASEIYAQLDQAWRILNDPEKRRAYDAKRNQLIARGEITPQIDGLLPPPTPERPPQRPQRLTDPGATRATNPGLRPTNPGLRAPSDPGNRSPIRRPTDPGVRTPRPQLGRYTDPGISRPTNPGVGRPSGPGLARPRPPEPPADEVNEDDDTVMFSPDAGRPPTPPPGIKRSLPYNASKRSRRPRLAIASTELVQVKVSRKPISRKIIIKNTGKGRMPGRIASDREWLEVTRSRLIADAAEQEVEVIIHPRKMPRPKSVALVSVITDHGERRAITFRVERRPLVVPVVAALVGGLALLAAAWFMGLIPTDDPGAEPPPTEQTTLEIAVDPSSDSVLINGVVAGRGDRLVLDSGFPVGIPFVLSAELYGFEPFERSITINEGETRAEEIALTPLAPPSFTPGAGDVEATQDPKIPRAAISAREAQLDACFVDNLSSSMSGRAAELSLQLYLDPKGRIIGFEETSKNYTDPRGAVGTCVLRQMLAVKFPAFTSGYFPLEYVFLVDIP